MTEKAVSPESRWYLVASLSHCPVDGPVAAQGLLRIKAHQKTVRCNPAGRCSFRGHRQDQPGT